MYRKRSLCMVAPRTCRRRSATGSYAVSKQTETRLDKPEDGARRICNSI